MARSITNVRIYKEDKLKLDNLLKEIQLVQPDKRIGRPEILRRSFNIPKLKNVLIEDAKYKRSLGL